jgi:hypothetical protein
MQLLQKDLRLLKVATEGKIPHNIDSFSKNKFENLISCGKMKISATCGNVDQNDISSDDVDKVMMTPIGKDRGIYTYPASPSVIENYPAESGNGIYYSHMTSMPWKSPVMGVPFIQVQGQTPWMFGCLLSALFQDQRTGFHRYQKRFSPLA